MPEPEGADMRLVELARRLTHRTNAGTADWRQVGTPGRYLYAARSGAVTLDTGGGPLAGVVGGAIRLTVHGPDGNEVGSLVARPIGSALFGSPGFIEASSVLHELAEAVQAQVDRRSQVIDQLIAEIG